MKALIIADLQNDYYSLGPLAIQGVDDILPIANQLAASDYFDVVVATQDWHPANHKSFAANHYWRYPGQEMDLNGVNQRLWGIHGVQESLGADFIEELNLDVIDKIVQKGQNPEVDSYSPFFDNNKEQASDLANFLQEHKVEQVFILGVATEYTVAYTAKDALALGFQTFIVEDACKACNWEAEDGAKALQELEKAGVVLLDSDQLIL